MYSKTYDENLNNRINDFLQQKNITNSFIQECVGDFISGHIKTFGNIISEDELFDRLNSNLDSITFTGEYNGSTIGEYKGRIADNVDQNEILVNARYSDLDISEYDRKNWNIYTSKDKEELLNKINETRIMVKDTIIHELTHAAYTIKGDYGIGENHIFSKNGKNLFGLNYYSFIGGNNNFVEAIVNYISSRIQGKNSNQIETYKNETEAIYLIANKMPEELIVRSAWDSDEKSFSDGFIKEFGKDYNEFNNFMARLITIRNRKINNIEQIGDKTSESKITIEKIKEFLGEKEIQVNSNNQAKVEKKGIIELDPLDKPKNGYDDVSSAPVRKGLVNKVTSFLKDLLNRDKAKAKDKDSINRGR